MILLAILLTVNIILTLIVMFVMAGVYGQGARLQAGVALLIDGVRRIMNEKKPKGTESFQALNIEIRKWIDERQKKRGKKSGKVTNIRKGEK